MKTTGKITVLFLTALLFGPTAVEGEIFSTAKLIKLVSAKVIEAIDLRIQRLQNKCIWLQNEQKKIEYDLTKKNLNEIAYWTQKQLNLYRDYFEELRVVKTAIRSSERVKKINQKQNQIVKTYQLVWSILSRDKHFSDVELQFIGMVYEGMMRECLEQMQLLVLVLKSYQTQMTDQKRLEIINKVDKELDAVYRDLVLFNKQNILLSMQRANSQNHLKQLYGIR